MTPPGKQTLYAIATHIGTINKWEVHQYIKKNTNFRWKKRKIEIKLSLFHVHLILSLHLFYSKSFLFSVPVCERAQTESWQLGPLHASLHLLSPLWSRCELCVCHLSESSAGSCTFPKTPAFRSTMLSWLLAQSTTSSTQATGLSTHSA